MFRPKFSLMGESALLCDFASGRFDQKTQARLWSACSLLRSRDSVGNVVAGINNLLVSFDPLVTTLAAVEAAVRIAWEESDAVLTHGAEHEIEVDYGGPDTDFGEVAATLSLSAREIVDLHVAPTYWVAAVGFMPGWGYLTGLDERLVLPRRSEPKTRVPSGSVLIASTLTAVMPLPSPSGWHVLGRTEQVLFSPDGEPHCLLACGDQVRFREARP